MPNPLDDRYPTVQHFMATNLFGVGPFEREIDDFVQFASSREVVLSRIADMRRLLVDPEVTDEALDGFVLDNAQRFIDQSGRRTIEKVADRLQWSLDNLPPPNPLTLRAPTLARLLANHARSRDEFDGLLRAGAAALREPAARTAASEAAALLADPELDDRQLSAFVRSHSSWLLQDSGRRTLERVVAVLQRRLLGGTAVHGQGEGGPLNRQQARAIAERLLDEEVRSGDDEIVIVDRHTRESADRWAFVYNTRAYVETGSFYDMLIGNAPILIDKATGQPRFGRTDISVEEQL